MSKKVFTGLVVSDKMQKTVVVAVEIPKRHPIYGKEIKNTQKFMAHNEVSARLGDKVTIQESRPLSRHKTWVVLQVLKQD